MKRLIPLLMVVACGEPASPPVAPSPSPQPAPQTAPAAPQAERTTTPEADDRDEVRRVVLEHLQAQYPNRPVDVGEPGPREGAAGSIFVEVPARVVLEPDSMAGTVTLRRVNDVPGSTAEQRSWRVYRTDLKPLQ